MSTLANFAEVMDLVVTGKLKPVLDKTFPLKEAAAAQERLCAVKFRKDNSRYFINEIL